MSKNKEYLIHAIMEKTNKNEQDCIVINDILENHFIIGHQNKEKIKSDFIEKLNMSEKEADELYNICSEVIVKNIFHK